MKKRKIFVPVLVLVFLAACSGSDFYLGEWKATDTNGAKSELLFEANTFSVTDSAGTQSSYEYRQNSVLIENGIRYYGIKLSDGRVYTLNFPLPGDPSKGAIVDAGNHVVYTIGRDAYISYDELFRLNPE